MPAQPSSPGPAMPEPPDYTRYAAYLAGFTGLDQNEICRWTRQPARRSHIGPRGMYKTGLTRLANGDLLACPCTETTKGGKWPITVFRSRDEGETWQRVETQGDQLLGKEPALATLSDGRVLLLTSHPHGFRVSRSDDQGQTWKTTLIGSAADDDKLHWDGCYETVRDVLEEPDGSLVLLMSLGTWGNREAPPSQAWLFRSDDRGATWAKHEQVKVWDDPEPMFAEVSIVRLPDGDLLATSRTQGDHAIGDMPPADFPADLGEAANHMMLMTSKDNGVTWTTPRPFLSRSEVHAHLLVLQDGRVLCTYATYHLPFGVFAMVSEDSGRTWDTNHPVQLGISWDLYVGWPTSIQLPDGDIVTAFAIRAYNDSDRTMDDQIAQAVRWQLPTRHPTAGP